jgi:hypothetical protein
MLFMVVVEVQAVGFTVKPNSRKFTVLKKRFSLMFLSSGVRYKRIFHCCMNCPFGQTTSNAATDDVSTDFILLNW